MILLGAPGAGKGTQAKLIADKFEILHVATGDLLRDAVIKETELGIKAKEYMSRGELVPDQIVIDLILERLKGTDAKVGYILDGFPRTVHQAEKLAKVEEVDIVLNLDVDFDLLLERLTGRRSCASCGAVFHLKYNPPKAENICNKCGSGLIQRPDDHEDVIKNRLETYNRLTRPLIEFYDHLGKLKNVPGDGEINGIFNSIVSLISPQ